jgi:hypothetical protein
MAAGNRHSKDGQIQKGDVVVSHINGTLDFYIIATVLSALDDLTLNSVSTMKGEDAAIMHGYGLRADGQDVWLFGGSAAAYVKAPTAEAVMSRVGQGHLTPGSVLQRDAHEQTQE